MAEDNALEEPETSPEAQAQNDDADSPAPESGDDNPTTENSDADSEQAEEAQEEVDYKAKLEAAERKLAKTSYEKREARRQAERATAILESLSKTGKSEPQAPKVEDFETLDDYLNARDDYNQQQRQPKADPTENADTAVFNQKRDDLMFEGAGKYEDFEDKVASPDTMITIPMANAIFEFEPESQVELAYYLASNVKEAARIARIQSPIRQAAEIGKLEAKLTAPTPAKRQPSTAPKPMKPVGGTNTSPDEISDGMNPEDFFKVRYKQLGRG